jgi:GT2 family glycosyltransferase
MAGAALKQVAETDTILDSPGGGSVRASIIIVNYNQRSHLDACLQSLSEDIGSDDEIIIVDNATSDGSIANVEANYPSIQIVRCQHNLGYAEGSNVGARHASGNFLVFLNPDTRVASGWVDALITELVNTPSAGLATSKILLMNDPQRINTAGNNIHIGGLAMCRGLGFNSDGFPRSEEVNAVSGAAFIIKRELFNQLDGFDADFFLYMEDIDLSWRARLAGSLCLYAPFSIVYHDYALRFGHQKIYYQERNRYMMLLKSLRWPTLFMLIPTLLLTEVISWGFVLLRDRKGVLDKLRAYQYICTEWSHILQKRRGFQPLRRVSDREMIRKSGFKISFNQVEEGNVGILARLVFNPIFFLLYWLLSILVWW